MRKENKQLTKLFAHDFKKHFHEVVNIQVVLLMTPQNAFEGAPCVQGRLFQPILVFCSVTILPLLHEFPSNEKRGLQYRVENRLGLSYGQPG